MILRPFICIPTFNNPKTIGKVADECLRIFNLPILVVDDGSFPAVSLKIESTYLHRIRFEKNLGKGAALQAGFRWGVEKGYTHMLSLDGDGQHPPREALKLLKAAEKNPFKLILGKRNLSSTDVPPISKFGRAFSNFWTRLETGIKIEDSQSGMRIYPLFFVQMENFF